MENLAQSLAGDLGVIRGDVLRLSRDSRTALQVENEAFQSVFQTYLDIPLFQKGPGGSWRGRPAIRGIKRQCCLHPKESPGRSESRCSEYLDENLSE